MDISNFINLIYSNSLLPTITQPTRITSHSSTLIDNIFTNSIQTESISGNLTCNISDHLPQFLIVPNQTQKIKIKNSNKFHRNFKNFDQNNFILDLLSINWNKQLNLNKNNANTTMENFLHIINSILDRYAPFKKTSIKQIKTSLKPWITPGILTSIKIKNYLYKKNTSKQKIQS